MFARSAVPRFAAAIALGLSASCGLINGLQGNGNQPGSTTPLSQLSWHGPEMIDHGLPVNSSAPVLAFGQGAAWVSFWSVDYNSQISTSWVTRRPRGGDFAAPVQLPNLADWNGGLDYPFIAIGGSGDAVVEVTALQQMSNGQITDESVWATTVGSDLSLPASGLTEIDDDTGGQESRAAGVAVDEAGTAIALYERQLDGVGLFARSMPLGGSWSGPVQVDTAFETGVTIAAGSAGNALIGTAQGLDDGGSFGEVSRVGPVSFSSSGPVFGPQIDFPAASGTYTLAAMRGAAGMAVGAIENTTTINTDAYSSGFWSGMQTVTDSHISSFVEPAVAVNSKGEAVLLWQDYSSPNTDGYAGTLQAAFWDGGSWSPQEQLSLDNPNPHAWWAAVDINDQGEAVVAWADFDSTGTFTRIFADVLETSSGAPMWSGAVPIDTPSPNAGLDAGLASDPANARYVGVALDPAGGLAQVVWIGYATNTALEPRVWSNWLETN